MARLSSIFLLFVLIFALSACRDRVDPPVPDSGTPQETVCTHDFSTADCNTPRTCKTCGATDGETLGHTWNAATCITPKTCSVCGVIDGNALGHTPNADDDGDCTTPVTCTACDTVVVEAKVHDFAGEAWQKDASGHWHVCGNAGCAKTDTVVSHTSDGSATETKAEKCSVCEYVIAPELEHTHNHNIPKNDANSHWNECACGDQSDVAPHAAHSDNDCTTDDKCSCGYTTAVAKDHVVGEDDGNCTTDIKCRNCEKVAVAGTTDHNDKNRDYVCDNPGCQVTVEGVPKDENPGIDLPMDTN